MFSSPRAFNRHIVLGAMHMTAAGSPQDACSIRHPGFLMSEGRKIQSMSVSLSCCTIVAPIC